MNNFPLTIIQKNLLLIASFLLVAFGQPVWSEWLSLASAFCGFAFFGRVLLSMPEAKKRFYLAFAWFAAVQVVQLSWFVSHPYFYIYGVLLFCALLMGVQWGMIAIFIKDSTISSISSVLAISGLWTLMEWSRLFILSGLPFNPIGLTLSGSLLTMQLASLVGVYGLSFWVIFSNFILLRGWMHSKWLFTGCLILFPFIYGALQLHWHQTKMSSEKLSVLLVQTALPIEENLKFQSAEEARQYVLDEWHHILTAIQYQNGKKIDLIVFPEYLVPYGTFHSIFPLQEIRHLFSDIFGTPISHRELFTESLQTDKGKEIWVSNAFVAQSLADLFKTEVIIGLEDNVYEKGKKSESYSSAFHFIPGNELHPVRYEKRILVPMGEYIPFAWCRQLAAQYGISGSFTCGQKPTLFKGSVPMGVSICYEEIYGNLIREARQGGAEILVNLTNDGWFPHSTLPKQHFDHARLRTVENGIPLVRACNTGITAAVDSLGQIIASFGDQSAASQDRRGSILVDVPLYHYQTLYSHLGNGTILSLSVFFILFSFYRKKMG